MYNARHTLLSCLSLICSNLIQFGGPIMVVSVYVNIYIYANREVYAKAKNIFESDLLKFGVSHETCKACYEEAGLEWQD